MKDKIIKNQQKLIISLLLVILFMLNIMIGIVGNYVVVKNNAGKMPVLSSVEYSTDTHFSFQDPSEINYYFLTDKFSFFNSIYSIGDLIMIVNFIFFIITAIFIIIYSTKLKKLKKEYKKWKINY